MEVEIGNQITDTTKTTTTSLNEINDINNYDSLIQAISKGCLDTIICLKETIPDLQLNGSMWDKGFPFKVACANGHIHIARWLLNEIPEIDVSIDCEDALRYACREGHIEIVKWLYEINPTMDVSVCFFQPFTNACNNGHFEIARWLYDTFPRVREMIKNADGISGIFRYSTIYNYINYPEIVNWLKQIKIQSVKEIIYSLNVKRKDDSENCCICYEKSNIETSCGHYGCEDCLSLISDHTCPYCRQFITDYYKIVD